MSDRKPEIKYPFLDLRLANAPYAERLKAVAAEVIDSGIVLHGQRTKQLEAMLSPESAHCVAVSNGLDALRLIFRAYIQMGTLCPGDEVIVSAGTYIASVIAISDCGLTPVLCDIDPTTLNLDTSLIENHITERTRAILTVHLYGNVCWDATLCDIARRHNLLVIEDNAQCIGGRSEVPGINGKNHSTGALGHAAAWSFYPTKNIGALGDAGAVTTDDEQLAHAVRTIANYGSDRRYHNVAIGLNCRIDEIQAAMLCVKLEALQEESERRRAVAKAYSESITNPLITKPSHLAEQTQVWHQYVIRCTERDRLREHLLQHGVGTDVHYPTPPHKQPCYAHLAHLSFPEAEALALEAVSLPIAYPIDPGKAREISAIINLFK